MADFPRKIMVDTGYWYAICDRSDTYHGDAADRFAPFESHGIIFPWPCLYETLNTRFVENRSAMQRFSAIARRPNVVRVDGLLTFNQKDFHDVCRRRRVEML